MTAMSSRYPGVPTLGAPAGGREHLSGADLRLAALSATCLPGADFRGADLREAWLRDSCLHAADLRDADLRDAELEGPTWTPPTSKVRILTAPTFTLRPSRR